MQRAMEPTEIMHRIREIADAEDVPVLGVGPAGMKDEQPGYRPQDLIPGARSLLCFGIPVPRGAYRPAPYSTETVWRSQNLYYRRLDGLSVRFAALIEETGESAVPVFGCYPLALNGKDGVLGYLNQLRMGEATGIGSVGRNGLLLNARYGARLMLGGVVTTASLPAFRRPESEEPGCPPDCQICVEECPVGAISVDKERVDQQRCLRFAAKAPLMPKLRYLLLLKLRPRAAERLMNLTAMDEHTMHVCSRCVSACPYGQDSWEPAFRR